MKRLLLLVLILCSSTYGMSQIAVPIQVYGPLSAVTESITHDLTSHAPSGTISVKLMVEYTTATGTFTAVSSPQHIDPGQTASLMVTISGDFNVISKKIVVQMPGGNSTWNYFPTNISSLWYSEIAPFPNSWYDESYTEWGELPYLDDILFWHESDLDSPKYFKIEGH